MEALDELVVLLTPDGVPCGAAPKRDVHGPTTAYHLAFSCYVFDAGGRLLVTQRARAKATWPEVWTNSCCGHPLPGEPSEQAVRRRLRHELGLEPVTLELALPAFSYRASRDGVEEHELCPVWLARVDGEPVPNPAEVAAYEWVPWPSFVARAERADSDLSPWARLQVRELAPYVERFLH
ncbi:MAG: isopentenyl-diphosphate Delta-isomerase [Mycobacterium leprae]